MGDATMLDAALRYAATGWPVFPCKPNAKPPMTVHGFKDATSDPVQITRWWSRYPLANVAIATGSPGPDVVDVDVKDGAPGAQSRMRLARVGLLRGAFAEVHTWSGGQHLYYPGTDQRSSSRKVHGIDFRAAGGYVLAPPSIVDGRPYLAGDTVAMSEGRPVNWSRIVEFLEPPRPKPDTWSGVRRHSPGALSRWAERQLTERIAQPVGPDRSGQFWELARLCRLAGMSETEAVSTLTPWCETTGKYVGRVDREITRVWRKVEVPA